MSPRIVWLDRGGHSVDSHEPDVTRYVRGDLYAVLAGALLHIVDGGDDPVEIARRALTQNNFGAQP